MHIPNVEASHRVGLSLSIIGHSSGKSPFVKQSLVPWTPLCLASTQLSIAVVQIHGPMSCGQDDKQVKMA